MALTELKSHPSTVLAELGPNFSDPNGSGVLTNLERDDQVRALNHGDALVTLDYAPKADT